MEFINPNLLKEVFRFSVFPFSESRIPNADAQVLGKSLAKVQNTFVSTASSKSKQKLRPKNIILFC